MTDAEIGGTLVALIVLIKTWIYFHFLYFHFLFEVCHNRNQALATSRPEDASGVQTGRDSAAGKDFNKDLGAGLDSLSMKLGTGVDHDYSIYFRYGATYLLDY